MMCISPDYVSLHPGYDSVNILKNLLSQRRRARREKRSFNKINNRFYLCGLCAFAREQKSVACIERSVIRDLLAMMCISPDYVSLHPGYDSVNILKNLLSQRRRARREKRSFNKINNRFYLYGLCAFAREQKSVACIERSVIRDLLAMMCISPDYVSLHPGYDSVNILKNLLSQRRRARREKRSFNKINNRFYLYGLCAFAREQKSVACIERSVIRDLLAMMCISPDYVSLHPGYDSVNILKNLLSQRRRARREKRSFNTIYNRYYLCGLCAFAREQKSVACIERSVIRDLLAMMCISPDYRIHPCTLPFGAS